MQTCEHCASHNVRSFTPARVADRAAVLLCMSCRKLTIVSPHARHDDVASNTKRAA